MPIFVKDAGQWREISSSTGGELFVRDATSYTNKTILNGYIKHSGTWKEFYTLFNTPSFSSATGSVAVPANANALHVEYAVAGGGGGGGGMDYDSRGYEDAGAGGGSGAFISDKVFSITGGETLTIATGTGGAGGSPMGDPPVGNPTRGGNGSEATLVSGTTSGPIFSLAVGIGATSTYGSVGTAGTGGSATISGTVLTTGTTVDGLNITTFTSGPLSAFNQSGNGVSGSGGNRCGGDNCNIGGANGAASYSGNIAGGTGGNAGNGGAYNSNQVGNPGTRGSGGGGGGTEQGAPGGVGGAGEIYYRFLRMT